MNADGSTQQSAVIGFRARFTWGAGSLGTISYLNTVTALVIFYLTTVVKLDAAVAGLLVASARVIDAFSDPMMGWITDRTHTRWGRRRPYLLLGAILCGLALPLVYSVHTFVSPSNAVPLVFAVLVLYSLGFTVFNVPYLTMPVEMTSDRLQRLGIMSHRVIFMMLGALLGNAGAPYLVDLFGGGPDAYQRVGVIAGVFVACVMLVTFFGTSGALIRVPPASHPPVAEQLRAIVRNRPFMILVAIKVLQFVALAASSSTAAFFVTVVLKQTFTLLAIFGLVTTVAIVISVPIWRVISRRMTKRRAFMIGVVGDILATLLWLLATPENSLVIVVIKGLLGGFFSSAILLNSQAMWLDAIDYDRQKDGPGREGMYTSFYVFVERLGYSIGPLLLGGLLSALHFDGKLPLDQQPASAELALYIGLVWLPIAMYAAALLFLTRYRLTEVIDGEARL